MAAQKPSSKTSSAETPITKQDFTPDQIAAHQLFTELWTRIATQRLEFGHGEEEAALDSLVAIFRTAREMMKQHTGAKEFYPIAANFLNGTFRRFMSEWHSKREDGVLNSRDGCVIFRKELRDLQNETRKTAAMLYEIAFGEKLDAHTPLKGAEDLQGPKGKLVYSASEADREPFDNGPLEYGLRKGDMYIKTLDQNADIIDQINAQETKDINARRKDVRGAPETTKLLNAVGLALSGGGIRSASFCLGIVQVLARTKLMDSVDVMSTVSGGGYTGGFLVRRASEGQITDFEAADGKDSPAIQYLRRRAKFLDMGSFARSLEFGTNMVAGMVLNWTVPAFLLSTICLLLSVWNLFGAGFWNVTDTLSYIMIGLGFLVYTIMPHSLEKLRLTLLRLFWWGGAGLMFFYLIYRLGGDQAGGLLGIKWDSISFSSTVAAIGGIAGLPIIGSLSSLVSSQAWRGLIFKAILFIASLSVPIIFLSFGFWLYGVSALSAGDVQGWLTSAIGWLRGWSLLAWLPAQPELAWIPTHAGIALLAIITALLFLTVRYGLDLNATGPHWIYRYGLKKTFVDLKDDPKEPEPDVPLATLNAAGKAPYFLINAVANLPSSHRKELRERNGDFFLFSRHFCGSPILGYRPTAAWKLNGKDVDLSTAIATSGAAVSPLMAMMTISSVRALMCFLNIRLGLWMRTPESDTPSTARRRPGGIEFLREMFGFGISEDRDWQLLTDGAHLDNSAVYELLRRRCKYIVAVDASTEDKEGHFSTLLTLVRHAKIDMGIKIKFNLQDLEYNPDTDSRAAHGMLCEITYPDNEKGLMLFVKLCLTGDEDAIIKGYKKANPAFPNQSTADQSYDEHQFEAYRALGEHAIGGFLEAPFVEGDMPRSVPDWLNDLYKVIPPSVASGTTPISEGNDGS